jgi:hypothetical protein
MYQTSLALEHYWHLRAQGVVPRTAAQHVRQRFGVDIPITETENAADDAVVVTNASSTDFGTEFANTIWGTSTGPQDALRTGA